MQRWDPNRYAENVRFVSDLGQGVVELLAPVAGERLLDLGCGGGVLAKQLAAMGCEVVGVDGIVEMIPGDPCSRGAGYRHGRAGIVI